jgi:hypothetical protein
LSSIAALATAACLQNMHVNISKKFMSNITDS